MGTITSFSVAFFVSAPNLDERCIWGVPTKHRDQKLDKSSIEFVG